MAVVETERFLKDVEPLLSDEERERLVAFMGANPEAGKIAPRRAASGKSVGLWREGVSAAARG
jgi:hypothetical protein